MYRNTIVYSILKRNESNISLFQERKMKLVDKIFKRNDWYVTSLFGYRDSINTPNGSTNNYHDGCDYGTHREKWPRI